MTSHSDDPAGSTVDSSQPAASGPATPQLRVLPGGRPGHPTGRLGGWDYEPPDVVGEWLHRARLSRACPMIARADLDAYVEIYAARIAPETRTRYETILEPFYRRAAARGFNPLTCDAIQVEVYLLDLMLDGRPGPDSDAQQTTVQYLRMFLTALAAAADAAGVGSPTDKDRCDKVMRGYDRMLRRGEPPTRRS